MTARARRRVLGFTLLAVASVLFLGVYEVFRLSLRSVSYFSGYTLFVVVLFLAAYNLRKKFPVPPFGNSRFWLQLHIYAGIFTFLVFFFHVGSLGVPTGVFERCLWLLYLGAAVSGVFGLFITRTFPQRLTSHGEEVIFERIPEVLRDLHIKAESLVEHSLEETGASTISDFYTARIRPFMLRPRSPLRHIVGYHGALGRRMSEIEDQYRYLNGEEQKTLSEIARCVRAKDALDQQYALQLVLKLWLFIHIPLSYALIVVTFLHILLVWAFDGGIV